MRLLQAAGLGQLNVADQSKRESLFAIAQATCDCKQGNGMFLAGGTGLHVAELVVLPQLSSYRQISG